MPQPLEKLKIVIGGFIGLYPSGGVTWDYIQYPLGFLMLGHDVYYIEDTGQYSTYRVNELPWDDPSDTVAYLSRTMEAFGLSGRWAYRDLFSGQCYGLSQQKIIEICATADIFINISESTILRSEYLRIPLRILIDSDPMFTQIQHFERADRDNRYIADKIDISDYNYHFSFGLNIGAKDCRIPLLGLRWIPTWQPVCLSWWKSDKVPMRHKGRKQFTTIMNWSTRSPILFENESWGQKDVEFNKFIDVPARLTEVAFKVILAVSAGQKKELKPEMISDYGWQILDPSTVIATTMDYQQFISGSTAEFSVAKETYVKSKSGWFSCRSACYLAMGRPVITQDTEWSRFIPSGQGLFSFTDTDTALAALREVACHTDQHAKAARELAGEYFDSHKVLTRLLNEL